MEIVENINPKYYLEGLKGYVTLKYFPMPCLKSFIKTDLAISVISGKP